MKKITLLGLLLASSLTYSQIYVDADATGTDDGSSWANAYTSLNTAVSNAADASEIWIAAGTYNSVPDLNLATGISLYGGFAGTETMKSERTTSDTDGNGIVEPWEFTNETIFSSTKTGYAIINATGIIDGLSIVHNATEADKAIGSVEVEYGGKVQNCIFKDSNITLTAVTNHNDAVLVYTEGDFENNLIENNTVTITKSADIKIPGLLSIKPEANQNGGAGYTININNNIIRNNQYTITDNTTADSKSTRGMIILATSAGTAPDEIVFTNNIVHNNTATFSGTSTATRLGGMYGQMSFSSSATKVRHYNNTYANNSSSSAIQTNFMIWDGNAINENYVQNNVFWGNQVNGTASSMKSNSSQNGASLVTNNYSDVAIDGNTSNATIFHSNVSDLHASNSGNANSPIFHTPTSAIGFYDTDNSVKLSDWRIPMNSYLTAKGTTIAGLTNDKAGVAYANPPAVGAYENDGTLSDSVVISTDALTITAKGFVSSEAGSVRLIKLNGQVVASQSVAAGEFIEVTTDGIYIIQLTTSSGTIAVKAIF